MSSGESIERSPRKHPGKSNAVSRAIAAFVPTGNAVELLALFENRVAITTIRQWRLGRRAMPAWARDLLKARAAPIDEIPVGVGRQVSKYNLPSIKEKARLQGGLDSLPLVEKR